MMRKHCLIISMLSLLLTLTSCGGIEFENLEINVPYVGLYQGEDCVVVFDRAEAGNVKGRVYSGANLPEADPIAFTSDLHKNGRGTIWIDSSEKKLKGVSLERELMRGNVGKSSFSLKLSPNSEMIYKPLYEEPCFEVGVEEGRVYASDVDGYWTSYPDTGEDFGTIYLKKLPETAATRKQNLDLDIYFPKEHQSHRHPLLLLIHGGAFYNGDKKAVGYPEMGEYFAERGYVVASINYRLGFKPLADDVDRAGYRAVQDAYAAVCYLLNNAEEFGIDPENVFAAGTSAGAITALNLAFMRNSERPESSKAHGVRALKLFEVLDLGNDLGPIEAVSGGQERSFNVKAVVNMWGAVHTLEMLNNSPETSILSFHGDADHIVPYGYGYPFDQMLDLCEDNMMSSAPDFIQTVAEWGNAWINDGKTVKELVFNPMYGSKAIDDKAQLLGIRSELNTVSGGGHSLHVDDSNNLSDYFYDVILPNMTRFLCEEMADGYIVKVTQSGPCFEVGDMSRIKTMQWQVEGGAILEGQGTGRVKVLFFGDAQQHSVTVGGEYSNGVEFRVKVK